MKQTRVFIILSILILTLGGTLVAYKKGYFGQGNSVAQITKVQIGGPFSLIDHTGKAVTEKDYLGTKVIISFGYTYCPDVCPTILSTMSTALDILGDDGADIKPLFVTIDPERDTVEVMGDYVVHFHPAFSGLTGTPEQIKAISKAYGVYAAKAQEDGADPDDYLMDHSALVYLMDEKGDYLAHFSHGVDPQDMANRLREHL